MTTSWQDIERESIRQRLEGGTILLHQAIALFSIEDLNQAEVAGLLFKIGVRSADGGLVTEGKALRYQEVVASLTPTLITKF